MFQSDIVEWRDVTHDDWSYKTRTANVDIIVFALDRVRDFSEPGYHKLGEQVAQRLGRIAQMQLSMLERLHDLGLKDHCAFALRLHKVEDRLRLFVVVRVTRYEASLDRGLVDAIAAQVKTILLPSYYSFERVYKSIDPDSWTEATDLSWAKEIVEIVKPQEMINGVLQPYYLYTPYWELKSDNDLRVVCEAIRSQAKKVVIDITLVPTAFVAKESEFLSETIGDMALEERGGELLNYLERKKEKRDGRPELSARVHDLNTSLESYSKRPLFIHGIRILSAEPSLARYVGRALTTQAIRTVPQSIELSCDDARFGLALRRVMAVDLVPEVQPHQYTPQSKPGIGKVQRFNRLASVDEIAGFWRLPIPLDASFPGFALDVGQSQRSRPEKTLRIGKFTSGEGGAQDEDVEIDIESLARHALVVGMPGSGKTTLIQKILYELWHTNEAQDAIPFLVLEPAKTEYRALKELGRFKEDLLVFTLGDERISPFRFNPFDVPNGIPVETHISRLNACFTGAFNLFDPLPILLDKSIRLMYEEKGWYDESIGGESGVDTPTLSDLYHCAKRVIESSGYSERLRDDFAAAMLQRLDSLRRGSKGRMLDTKHSISVADMMRRPVVLELDPLNDDEKALIMMFVLTFVYEIAKTERRSGSPLRHVLVAEEAHNLIGRSSGGNSDIRANPKEQAIRLFTRMLAEMRALGEGILIADQLPTAIAQEAVKQTNVKILLRLTSMDDRKEIGNTMNLSNQQVLDAARFSSGQAYIATDQWPTARSFNTFPFKKESKIEVPPDDVALVDSMEKYHEQHRRTFMPFADCSIGCESCNRRVRSQVEKLMKSILDPSIARSFLKNHVFWDDTWIGLEESLTSVVTRESARINERTAQIGDVFGFCVAVHFLNMGDELVEDCREVPTDFRQKLISRCRELNLVGKGVGTATTGTLRQD